MNNIRQLLTLSELKENLKIQLNEIEMLQSVYCNPGEFRLENPSAVGETKHFIDNISCEKPSRLDSVFHLIINDIKFEVSVNISHGYPLTNKPDIFVRSAKLSKTQHSELNKRLNNFINDQDKGTECIFSAISWIQDNADTFIEILPETCTSNTSTKDEKLVRMWLYSHHIYSKTKRREIIDQANQLKLNGFCLPGKPGVICIEGPSSDCNEWWQIIRNMGWKKLFIKVYEECNENPETFRKFNNFEEIVFQTNSLKCQHMDLGEFLKFLEDHKCGYIFKEIFGIDNSKNQIE